MTERFSMVSNVRSTHVISDNLTVITILIKDDYIILEVSTVNSREQHKIYVLNQKLREILK